MTRQEFIDQFDIWYNNINSNQAPGLDNYEKSVFLTKAQDEILKSYFDPKLNKVQEGFDGSQRRQIDFSMILKTDTYTASLTANKYGYFNATLPSEAMIIINEFFTVTRNGKPLQLVVIPLSYIDWIRVSSKPYKRPSNYQAWRLINNGNQITIITGANDTINPNSNPYEVRYIKRPYPIILESLIENGVSINGETKPLYKNQTPEVSNDNIFNWDNIFRSDTAFKTKLETDPEIIRLWDLIDTTMRNQMVAAASQFICSHTGTAQTLATHDTLDLYVESLRPILENNSLADENPDIFYNVDTVLASIKGTLSSAFCEARRPVTGPEEVCELDPILHMEILQRAVELAKATYMGNLDTQISIGNASATNLGIVPQPKQQQQ